MLSDILIERRHDILRIAAKYGAGHVRVFGSMARGDARENSDLDLLVDFEPGRSLLDHAGLMLELEELLKRPVDIGATNGLRMSYRERIINEAVLL